MASHEEALRNKDLNGYLTVPKTREQGSMTPGSIKRQISWGTVANIDPHPEISHAPQGRNVDEREEPENNFTILKNISKDGGQGEENNDRPAQALTFAEKIPLQSKVDPVAISSLGRSNSRSSLASTLGGIKGKIESSMGLSKKSEKKRLKVFVCFLFVCCTAMILSTHIFYRQHIGELRLFKRVRLEEEERRMLLYDQNNELVSGAEIGLGIPTALHPYKCLPKKSDAENEVCLEWKDHARLRIRRNEYNKEGDGDGVTCHRLYWESLNPQTMPMDCWPVGEEHGHWYGGGESLVSKWPLGHGRIKMSPFVTGDEEQTEWGNVIRKFFINSKGLSITIDDETPLSVSLNDPDLQPGLCLKAEYDVFPYYYHKHTLPRLNYTVCTDGHLGEIYNSQLPRAFWDGHKDSDLKELKRLLQVPLWEVPSTENGNYTRESIVNYLSLLTGRSEVPKNSSRRGSAKKRPTEDKGYLRLNYHWQTNMGDLKITPELSDIQDIVSSSGLTLVLTINPFVSTDSPNFKLGVRKGYFVMERNNSTSSKNIPALTWFKDVPAAALLDITNPSTVEWLRNNLKRLANQLRDTVFFLDTGNVFHTPHYFQFHQQLNNPDLYKEQFVRTCMEEVRVIGVSGASSERPKAPAFVQMTPLASNWSSLPDILHNVLHLGVIGYPFINPGPIGGSGVIKSGGNNKNNGGGIISTGGSGIPPPSSSALNSTSVDTSSSDSTAGLPEFELYVRWWQLATFLPQLHFTRPPSSFLEANITGIARRLKHIKEAVVNPLLVQFGLEAMELSMPIIRPLWMINPLDEVAQRVDDAFLIGDRVLVAPILRKGQRSRKVYLPAVMSGSRVWKRETDGTYFDGGQWIEKNEAELGEIIFFTRQAEGARPGRILNIN